MRGAIVLLAGLAFTASATAAPPRATASASPSSGPPCARHGYPSVPAYPASHGCVRVPMWIAPALFDSHDFGTTVSVHA